MSQFSTPETVSLEKTIDGAKKIGKTAPERLESAYEIGKCATWIKTNGFQKVCLQFPDYLLPDSAQVALKLQEKLGQHVFVLADTAYESCCIDYVAAGHVSADAIVHFGPTCFSATAAKIPHLNVYEKSLLNFERFCKIFGESHVEDRESVIFLLDTCHIHVFDEFLSRFPSFAVNTLESNHLDLKDHSVVFVGDEVSQRKLANLKFTFKPRHLFFYNGDLNTFTQYETDAKILKRRYFLIEKIKDSNTVGIVIGTLGVKNYLQVIERLKKLLALHQKKYYLVSVGKPTVAKLANFPEIDVYCIVTCALNEIYDSRDFFKPIVTPYDVEVALNPESSALDFSLDYNSFVSHPISDVIDTDGDVSLISGKIRARCEPETEITNIEQQVALKMEGTVSVTSHAAGFLSARSWRGLEQNLGQSEVTLAGEGRRGIAQRYSEEKDFE